MDQRRTTEWGRGSEQRIRVLIEDPKAGWFDDFSRFRAAGFEVAVCTGPVAGATEDDAECPHAAGRKCALWEDADVVLCALPLDDATCRVALEGGRRDHPETPIVLARDPRGPVDLDLRLDTELIEGTYPLRLPASVDARIHALRAAVWRHAAAIKDLPSLTGTSSSAWRAAREPLHMIDLCGPSPSAGGLEMRGLPGEW